MQWLLSSQDAVRRVRELYREAVERWTVLANGNPVAGRAAQYVAALDVAKELLHGPLGVPAPAEDPIRAAWAAVVAASFEADRASDALRDVLSWATSQQHRFYGRLEGEAGGADETPAAGWLGAWSARADWRFIAILPTELRGFLERHRYDVEAILRTWEERGWIQREDGHRTKKVTIGGRKERCMVVSRTAVDRVSDDQPA